VVMIVEKGRLLRRSVLDTIPLESDVAAEKGTNQGLIWVIHNIKWINIVVTDVVVHSVDVLAEPSNICAPFCT
jgi:hypothetical protein